MTTTSKIIFGLLGAAAAGIAIGMLLEPEKSAEIRKKIGDTASDLASRVGDMITSGKEKISEIANTVSNQSDGFVNDVSNRAKIVKDSVG